MFGKDPMTGTTVDGVHGGKHGYGKDATKIKTLADFVRAYDKIVKNAKYGEKVAIGDSSFAVKLPIKEVLGNKWRARIMGRARV